MQLRPFLLDRWIDHYAGAGLPYNLAGSTGPGWTIDEVLRLKDGALASFASSPVSYQPSTGRADLRAALARMSGVAADEIVVTAGASEALFHVFFLAARPNANVIVPSPGFPTYYAIPEALGLEVRTYDVLAPDAFDLDTIKGVTDANTCLIVVNSPHNPTGSTIGINAMRGLEAFAVSREIQLVCDEVFHPIYHGTVQPSAATLERATVVGDLSKAFALPGLRIGWIREPDASRRAEYVNAREYLSVSNTVAGEFLAEIAVSNHQVIHERTQRVTTENLAVLEALMSDKASCLRWSRPQGGTTAFIRVPTLTDTRPFCIEAAKKGLLLVPGDCFDVPDYIRIGLGADPVVFAAAMKVLAGLLHPA